MAAGREHIDAHRIHIDGNLAIGLDGIRMEEHARLPGDFADFGHGLYRAVLVVGKHDADEDGIRPDGGLQLVQRNSAVFIHVEIRYLKAMLLQILAGMQHGVMLDFARDDMFPLFGICLGRGLDGPVIRFAAAGREVDFLRLCPKRARDDFPCMIDCRMALLPQAVDGRGVAIVLCEIREHRLHHFRAGCRRCGVI